MEFGVDAGIPWIQGNVPIYTGALRDNIRAFLRDFAAPVAELGLPLVSCWNVELRSQHSNVVLQIFEERLDESSPAFCDPCRIIGAFQEWFRKLALLQAFNSDTCWPSARAYSLVQ